MHGSRGGQLTLGSCSQNATISSGKQCVQNDAWVGGRAADLGQLLADEARGLDVGVEGEDEDDKGAGQEDGCHDRPQDAHNCHGAPLPLILPGCRTL